MNYTNLTNFFAQTITLIYSADSVESNNFDNLTNSTKIQSSSTVYEGTESSSQNETVAASSSIVNIIPKKISRSPDSVEEKLRKANEKRAINNLSFKPFFLNKIEFGQHLLRSTSAEC